MDTERRWLAAASIALRPKMIRVTRSTAGAIDFLRLVLLKKRERYSREKVQHG